MAVLLLAWAGALPAAKDLEIYAIDVEGGQATLFVTPSGQTLLIDAGWPGLNHRDADRIAAAAKAAGVKKIDYLLITHYHADHVGGVQGLAEEAADSEFRGSRRADGNRQRCGDPFQRIQRLPAKGNHIVVHPGDMIPITHQIIASAIDEERALYALPIVTNPECQDR